MVTLDVAKNGGSINSSKYSRRYFVNTKKLAITLYNNLEILLQGFTIERLCTSAQGDTYKKAHCSIVSNERVKATRLSLAREIAK